MCFLFASNYTLFLLLSVFLRLCLPILFDILFPFSIGLRLRYPGNKPVYFSTCLFVISCNLANIPLHWPSFSIKLLAILFTFVVSALWFASFALLPRCSSLFKLMICLSWKRERVLTKSSSACLRMRLTSFLNSSSALTLARALYRKDAGQVPLSESFYRLSIAFWAFLIRSSAGNVGVSFWRCFLGFSLSAALFSCLSCLLA